MNKSANDNITVLSYENYLIFMIESAYLLPLNKDCAMIIVKTSII